MSGRNRAKDEVRVRFDVVVVPKIEHTLLVEHVILVHGIEKWLYVRRVAECHAARLVLKGRSVKDFRRIFWGLSAESFCNVANSPLSPVG